MYKRTNSATVSRWTNYAMGIATVLTVGLVLWPLVIGAVISVGALYKFERRWWHSPSCFILAVIIGSAVSLWWKGPPY